MKLKTIVAVLALAAVPFFTIAGAQHADHYASQAAVEQGTGSRMMAGHAMGQGMMDVIEQVRSDLAALVNENDASALHKKITQDERLLEQVQSHMQSMKGMTGSMMSGGKMAADMMSGHIPNCAGTVPQPQK